MVKFNFSMKLNYETDLQWLTTYDEIWWAPRMLRLFSSVNNNILSLENWVFKVRSSMRLLYVSKVFLLKKRINCCSNAKLKECHFNPSCSVEEAWHKKFLDDIIMTVTWPECNLKTRNKMRTGLDISGSTSTTTFELFQNCGYDTRN